MDILSIDKKYQDDSRKWKCNLSIGCLFDENWKLYHYPSVKAAIKRCADSEIRLWGYENERGNPVLHKHLKELLLDRDAFSVSLTEWWTHALNCAISFLRARNFNCVALWTPEFPRHPHTIQSVINSPFSPLKIKHGYNEYLKFIESESMTPRALLLQAIIQQVKI